MHSRMAFFVCYSLDTYHENMDWSPPNWFGILITIPNFFSTITPFILTLNVTIVVIKTAAFAINKNNIQSTFQILQSYTFPTHFWAVCFKLAPAISATYQQKWQVTPIELTCKTQLLGLKGPRGNLNLTMLYYAAPNVATSACSRCPRWYNIILSVSEITQYWIILLWWHFDLSHFVSISKISKNKLFQIIRDRLVLMEIKNNLYYEYGVVIRLGRMVYIWVYLVLFGVCHDLNGSKTYRLATSVIEPVHHIPAIWPTCNKGVVVIDVIHKTLKSPESSFSS